MKELFLGREGSSSGDGNDEEVEYEIGTKISETVELYSEAELKEPGLKLKSNQVQRVLNKWVEELMRVLCQSEETVAQNKTGYKSMNGKYTVHLTTARKEELARKVK